MAPLQGTKRSADALELEEERAAKRAEGVPSAAELEQLVVEDDEDLDDESDGDLDAFLEASWRREDFTNHVNPVELSEEQLGKFNAAFQAAQAEWASEEGRVLVISNPLDVRPVPQSLAELQERLATFRLSDYGAAQRLAFEDELEEAMLDDAESEDEEATEDGEEPKPDAGDHAAKVLALLQTYTKTAQEEKDPAQALQVAVVVTNGLLDAELGDLLDDEQLKAGLDAVLGSLAKVWQGLLAKTSSDLGLSAPDRRGAEELVKMIRTSVDDATFLEGKLKGTFAVEVVALPASSDSVSALPAPAAAP